MWKYETRQEKGWKYTVTSDRFVITLTGGSIAISNRGTNGSSVRHGGHNYLYTGDISPHETQCFGLENGKHFFVYSLEDLQLIRRVTLPRGYECIDMYGRYSEDGRRICIPAHKWIGQDEGHWDYTLFSYDAQTLQLVGRDTIEDPEAWHWELEDDVPVQDKAELAQLYAALDQVLARIGQGDDPVTAVKTILDLEENG